MCHCLCSLRRCHIGLVFIPKMPCLWQTEHASAVHLQQFVDVLAAVAQARHLMLSA